MFPGSCEERNGVYIVSNNNHIMRGSCDVDSSVRKSDYVDSRRDKQKVSLKKKKMKNNNSRLAADIVRYVAITDIVSTLVVRCLVGRLCHSYCLYLCITDISPRVRPTCWRRSRAMRTHPSAPIFLTSSSRSHSHMQRCRERNEWHHPPTASPR